MKKIIVLILLVFSLGNSIQVFADDKVQVTNKSYQKALKKLNDLQKNGGGQHQIQQAKNMVESTRKAYNNAKKEAKKEYEADCAASGECLEQPSWVLKVGTFVSGNTFEKKGLEERADELFTKIIKSLMIALGVLAVFIMTIGGGYMILHNGQDELLNKGKTIFMSGIYAVVIALVSYFLVDIIASILYAS